MGRLSQENIEKIRRGQAGFTRGDLSSLRRDVADNVDWGTTGSFPGVDDAYRGPEALERWMDAVRSAWEAFEVATEEVVRDADEVLVIRERLWGRGRGSGAEVEMRIFSVYWFERGQIVKRRVFESREEALEAAGLRDVTP